jgi:hypothetical protein
VPKFYWVWSILTITCQIKNKNHWGFEWLCHKNGSNLENLWKYILNLNLNIFALYSILISFLGFGKLRADILYPEQWYADCQVHNMSSVKRIFPTHKNHKTEGWGMRDEGWRMKSVECGMWTEEHVEHVEQNWSAWGNFGFRPFRPVEVVLENGFEKWFFLLFSNSMFLESWDWARNGSFGFFRIRGHLSSWEVVKGQIWKLTESRHVVPFWKPLEVSMVDLFLFLG